MKVDLSKYVITIPPFALVVMMILVNLFKDFFLKLNVIEVVAIMLFMAVLMSIFLMMIESLINRNK